MSKETNRCARSLQRLVSLRWTECARDFQRMELPNGADFAMRRLHGRWEVWFGKENSPTRDYLKSFSRRDAAERFCRQQANEKLSGALKKEDPNA